MGENADRAGKDEQAPAELRLEAELAEDHGRYAVDVHRDVALGDLLERHLDCAPDRRPPPGNHTGRFGLADELEQWRGPRIDRMEAVSEAGDDLLACVPVALDDGGPGRDEIPGRTGLRVDLVIELHALLTGTAVDIVEHVD